MKPFLICLILFAAFLFLYIEKLNQLTALRLEIPLVSKEVKDLQEENRRLQYEIDQFESPLHLMEMLKKPEFSHLKYPKSNEVVVE